MNTKQVIYLASILLFAFGSTLASAGTIDFSGNAVLSVSVTSNQSYEFLGSKNVAEIGNYLGYPHENQIILATNTGVGNASISASGMFAENKYQSTFETQGQLHASVNGFLSQFNENRLDLYFNLSGGNYTFDILVDYWQRSLGWDQSGGGAFIETGWYSNLYAKLVRDGVVIREANLVLVSDVNNDFSSAIYAATFSGSANSSLSFANVDLDPGQYTLYLADYMTQYGVDPPSVPLPGSLFLFGSGLLRLMFGRRKTLS